MCGFVRRNLFSNQCTSWTHVEAFALCLVQEGIRRQEDQPRPTLAFPPRHLSQRQLTVGKRTESVRIVADGPSCKLRHRGCIPRRRRRKRRSNQIRRGVRPRRGIRTHPQGGRRAGEVPLHATRSVSLYDDIPGLRRSSNILAKVESGYGDGPLRDPVRYLLVIDAWRRGLRRLCRGCGERFGLARRYQRPTRRIVEGKIEIRHGHPAIGIPCAARSHVKQTPPSLS